MRACRCNPRSRCGACLDFVENGTACDTCGEESPVMVQTKSVFGPVTYRWRQCAACERREFELGDTRAQAAIEEAERSGV